MGQLIIPDMSDGSSRSTDNQMFRNRDKYMSVAVTIAMVVQVVMMASLVIGVNIKYQLENQVLLEYECMKDSNLCISIFSRVDDSVPTGKGFAFSSQQLFKVLEMEKSVHLMHQEYFHFVNYQNNPADTQQIIFDELTAIEEFSQEFRLNFIRESIYQHFMMPNIKRSVFYSIKQREGDNKIYAKFPNQLSIQVVKLVLIGLSAFNGVLLVGFFLIFLLRNRQSILNVIATINLEQCIYSGLIIAMLFAPVFKRVTAVRQLIIKEVSHGLFWLGSLRCLCFSVEIGIVIGIMHACPFRVEIDIVVQAVVLLYYFHHIVKQPNQRIYATLFVFCNLMLHLCNNIYWFLFHFYCVDTNQRIVQGVIIEATLIFALILQDYQRKFTPNYTLFNMILSPSQINASSDHRLVHSEEQSMKVIELNSTDISPPQTSAQ